MVRFASSLKSSRVSRGPVLPIRRAPRTVQTWALLALGAIALALLTGITAIALSLGGATAKMFAEIVDDTPR